VTPQSEVVLIAGRELRKNLRSVKGIILLLLSLLGGTLTSVLIVRSLTERFARVPPELLRQEQEKVFTQAFRDAETGKYMADAPLSLFIMFNLCVWLAPALVWLASFDGISGEIQHRSIRYWTVRTRRTSFYVGKFFGLWATIGVITFAMHLLTWIVAIAEGHTSAGNVVSWGVRFWLASVPIVGAWCGIAVFVGSFFRTPMTSLLVVGFAFFLIFMLGAVTPAILAAVRDNIDDTTARVLSVLYPNSYDRFLLSPHIDKLGLGLLACLAIASLPTAAGAVLLDRKDV
jgi:ABC-type transport system involved in multi-copper enzyme maturation permease subunit